MLACVRSRVSRAVSRRYFATVVDASGIRVAAVDHGQASSTVTVVVKAGSRHESKPGAAHLLKNYAFKNTTDRSALRLAREAEYFGGVLSAAHGREHLALTAAFLKGDEAHFVDLLASVLTKTRYTPHEFAESVLPSMHAETTEASDNPTLTALDLAHTLAFRSGLGASLFASPHAHLTPEDARSFAHTVFSKENIAVVGTGIDPGLLSKLVAHSFAALPSSSAATPATTKCFGGESRVAASGHGAHQPQTVFIGYGTTAQNLHELAVLKAYLSPHPQLKWAHGSTSALFEGLPAHARVEPVLLPYTDAALFGVLVQAPTTKDVREASRVTVNVLKGAEGSVKATDLKKAVSKAKFEAASALERREGVVGGAIAQLLKDKAPTLEATLAGLDKVDGSALAKAASTLIKTKPVFVAVGDIHGLPYGDELGL